MTRILIMVGLLVLVAGFVILSRQSRDPAAPVMGAAPPGGGKVIGNSALSHGGPVPVPPTPPDAKGGR